MTQTVQVPGVGKLNFPDGMSQQDMAAAIEKNFPQQMAAVRSGKTPTVQVTDKGPHAGVYTATDTGKPVITDPAQDPAAFAAQQGTAVQNLGAGYGAETLNMGRSLMDTITNAATAMQPGGAAASMLAPQKTANPDQAQQDALYANSTAAKVGRFGADVVNTAPAAMVGGEAVAPLTEMVQGSGAMPAILRAAISGAGQGAGAAGVMPADSIVERLKNMGEGAAIGGAFNAAGTGIVKGLGALKNAATTQMTPEIDALQKMADSNGVPLSYGDVTGNPFVKKAEVGLEKVPFSGMGDFRQGQSQALQTAGQKLVSGFDNTAGADPNDLIQSAAQKLLASNKAKATQMFNGVRDLVGNVSNNPTDYTPLVNMNGTKAAAQNILDKFGANSDVMGQPAYLQKIAKFADAQPRSFEEARQLRSALGQNARQAAKGAISGATSDQEASAWNQLQSATEGDLQNFADNAGGKLKQAYQDANQFYRENVVPFKDPKLRNLVTGKMDTDTLLNTFVKNERPQLAEKLYSNLTPDGQQTLKYAVLQKAMDQATDQGARNGAVFSPAKFALTMEKMGDTKSVLFSKDELTQVDGFAKLARAASRAGQYAENPPTGNRLADLSMWGAAGAGAVTHPVGTGSAIFGANVMRSMLTKPWGRSILMRAASTESPSTLRQLATYAAGRLAGPVAAIGVQYLRSPSPQTPASPQP